MDDYLRLHEHDDLASIDAVFQEALGVSLEHGVADDLHAWAECRSDARPVAFSLRKIP